MAGLNWPLYTERAVGKGHPTLSQTVDRALRQLLTESGYNPDADPFPGLMGPVFNVRAYGAAGDGTTDDTAAIQEAIDAAEAAGGGTVVHPGGTSRTSATVTVPAAVALTFGPSAVLKATGSAFGPMVLIEQTGGGFGSRYGAIDGLRLDGNSIATVGLKVSEGCVQRLFDNCDVRNCTSQGILVSAAQNNTFVACHSELNGNNGADDANLAIDLGAGNNVFTGCEFSDEHATTPAAAGARYNILILQSGASPSGAFTVPTGNAFYGCRAERISTSTLASVCQRAGRYNSFNRTDIQTYGARDAVQVDSSDGVSHGLRFVDCAFSGQATLSTAFRCTGTEAPAVLLEGANFWENFSVGLAVADTTNVEVIAVPQGSVTTFVSPLGSDTAPGLLTQRVVRMDGSPSNSTGVPPGIGNTAPALYDATNHRLWFYAGAWRSAAVDEVGSVTYAAGNNNDQSPGSRTTIRATADAAGSTLTGFGGGAAQRRLRIINVSANTLTLSHQDAASTAANRLLSPTGANVALAQDDVADLEYDATTQRWRIVNVLT